MSRSSVIVALIVVLLLVGVARQTGALGLALEEASISFCVITKYYFGHVWGYMEITSSSSPRDPRFPYNLVYPPGTTITLTGYLFEVDDHKMNLYNGQRDIRLKPEWREGDSPCGPNGEGCHQRNVEELISSDILLPVQDAVVRVSSTSVSGSGSGSGGMEYQSASLTTDMNGRFSLTVTPPDGHSESLFEFKGLDSHGNMIPSKYADVWNNDQACGHPVEDPRSRADYRMDMDYNGGSTNDNWSNTHATFGEISHGTYGLTYTMSAEPYKETYNIGDDVMISGAVYCKGDCGSQQNVDFKVISSFSMPLTLSIPKGYLSSTMLEQRLLILWDKMWPGLTVRLTYDCQPNSSLLQLFDMIAPLPTAPGTCKLHLSPTYRVVKGSIYYRTAIEIYPSISNLQRVAVANQWLGAGYGSPIYVPHPAISWVVDGSRVPWPVPLGPTLVPCQGNPLLDLPPYWTGFTFQGKFEDESAIVVTRYSSDCYAPSTGNVCLERVSGLACTHTTITIWPPSSSATSSSSTTVSSSTITPAGTVTTITGTGTTYVTTIAVPSPSNPIQPIIDAIMRFIDWLRGL